MSDFVLRWFDWLTPKSCEPRNINSHHKHLLSKLNQMGSPIYINHNNLANILCIPNNQISNDLDDLLRNGLITLDKSPFGTQFDLIKIEVKKEYKFY